MSSTTMRRAAPIAAVLTSLLLAACGKPGGQQAPPPAEVGIVVVDERPVPLDLTYMARTAGVREVEVRARVGGILLQRQYEEGTLVQQGALLFRIDPAPYQAETARARAQLAAAKAQFEESRRERDRVTPLISKGLVSRREHDQTLAAFESAEAGMAAADAAFKRAQLDLSYTEVRAPISGLTSRERRSEGSLVTLDGDANLLTRIVQTDPMYIEFGMPAGEAAMVRSSLGQSGIRVVAMTADGKPIEETAELTFIDTAIDQSSGTVLARATAKNPQKALVPGQFLRAKVEGVMLPKATVVPARGILHSPMGAMVWVVGEEDKVQPRPVQLGSSIGNDTVVLSGLKAGERVVVEGVIKVMPGAVVKPVPFERLDKQAEAPAASPGTSQTEGSPPARSGQPASNGG